MDIKWCRYGGYEVSSRGDKRFSAFYARLPDGRSIEEAYQLDVKGYRKFGNNPMLGKGKPPLDRSLNLYQEYLKLWVEWARHHHTELRELRDKILPLYGYILSDSFATTEVNQAHALSDILSGRWKTLI
jgi:hypothetical protein